MLHIFPRFVFLVFIFVSFSSPFLLCQTKSDSLITIGYENTSDNFKHRFEKQLNTYTLRSSLLYNTSFNNFSIGINESYNSTIVKSQTKNIKDENRLSLFGEYRLSPLLSMGLLINNKMYVDDRQLALSNAFSLQTSVYGKIFPQENVSVMAYGGYSTNRQIGEEDLGFIYGSEMLVNHLAIEDFELFSTLKFQNEDILPRRNLLRQANFELSNTIDQRIDNKFTFYYFQDAKDFYFKADSITTRLNNVKSNIQNRNERQYHFEDRFSYDPGITGLYFDLQARLSWRDIDKKSRYSSSLVSNSAYFDTKIEEFKINFDILAKYNISSFNGIFRLNFYEQEERFSALANNEIPEYIFLERSELETRKNNKSQVIALSLLGNIDLSNKDALSASAYHRKLKYDTSSELNFDDRDELLSIFRIMYFRKMSSFFNLFVNLESSFNHIVYVFAERSSNNNRRRIFKLAAGGNYKGKYVSSRNSLEVSANYTTYDFEDLNPNFQSFSFRQFTARDSTSIKVTPKVRFSFFGTLKLSEQGEFKWSDFSSKPIRYLTEMYFEPKIYYRIKTLDVGVGVRYFNLATYSYSNNDWLLQSDYQSIGPLAELLIEAGSRLRFRLLGLYEFIERKNSASQQLINMNLELYWLL